MAEKIVIAELEIDINALIKSTSEVKQSIDALKKAQQDLVKQGDSSSQQFVQNSADLKTLNSAYNSNLKAIADSSNAQSENANRTQLIALALQSEVTSIKEAREQNSLLNKLRNETNATTVEGKAQITSLNNKLDENNKFIKENADQYLKQKIGIGDYARGITEASQVLGYQGTELRNVKAIIEQLEKPLKLIKDGFKQGADQIKNSALETEGFGTAQKGLAIATNIGSGAMRIFAVAVAATGIGLILVAVALLIGYFKKVDPVVDKVEQGMAALGAVVRVLQQALVGLLSLDFSGFSNLGGKMNEAAKAAANLKEAQQDLQDLQNSQEVANAKASQQYDELILKSKNRTLTEKERIDFINKAQKIEEANFNQRSNLSEKELNNAIEQGRISAKLTDEQVEKYKRLGIAYANYLLNAGKITQEDYDAFKAAELKKTEILAESTRRLEKSQNAEDKLHDDAAAKQLKRVEDAQRINEEIEKKKQKALDDALAKSQAELNLFLSNQGIKAKTLEEGLKLAELTYQKQLEINQKQFDASKKTEADKLNLLTANNNTKNTLLQSQTDLVISNGQHELDVFIQLNKSKLDAQKFLSDESVQTEKDRLERIANEQKDFSALELANGTINKQAYDDAIRAIDTDTATKKEELRIAKVQADLERDALDLENKRIANQTDFENEFANRELQLNEKEAQEVLAAGKNGASVKIINDKYANLRKGLDNDIANYKLEQERKILAGVMGIFAENTVAYKAAATARILIDTITEFNKAKDIGFSLLANPATAPLATNAFIQAGLIAASGALEISKIAGVKFEQGGTMEVGGNRHSQGGTKFVGSDGTRFEAERGELIGVLNRNASSQFMAFNNAFGSGGKIGTSYAESGGIIARGMDSGISSVERLAAITMDAISSLPAPRVAVDEINSVATRVAVIENGANH